MFIFLQYRQLAIACERLSEYARGTHPIGRALVRLWHGEIQLQVKVDLL
jgi:hypothetical protein